MSRIISILISLFICYNLFSQEAYYKTDSIMHHGVKLIDGGREENSRLCQMKLPDGSIKQYTPDDIIEYGFESGIKYYTKEFVFSNTPKLFFFEKLNEGNLELFYLKSKEYTGFAYEEEGEIKVLHKIDSSGISYREILGELTSDYLALKDYTRYVRYNRSSLLYFLDRYTNHNNRPYARIRYSIIGGVGFREQALFDLQYRDNPWDSILIRNKVPQLGISIEIPVLDDFISFQPEISYSMMRGATHWESDNYHYNYRNSISLLKSLIQIRAKTPTKPFRTFVDVGFISVYRLQSENYFIETSVVENVVKLKSISTEYLMPTVSIGYGLGAGVEMDIGNDYSVSLKCRYEALFPNNGLNSRALVFLTEFRY